MRVLNKLDIDFLKDLEAIYSKYGVEIEILIPNPDDKKDYMYEVSGQTEDFKAQGRRRTYLVIVNMPYS